MRILTLLLTTSCVAGGLSWSHGGSTSSGPSGSPAAGGGSSDATYDRWTILGAKLGEPLEQARDGFVCGPPRGTGGFTTQNHSCVKFLDERCKDRTKLINNVHGNAELPRGQTCFMDEFTAATYLDREFMAPPLKFVRITGSDSPDPKVFQITYTFPADDLTETSNLGKALIAKYGQPVSTTAPLRMTWRAGGAELRAACRTIGGEHAPEGEFCTITVEDGKIDDTERERQHVAEDAARRNAAPPPM